MKRLKVYFTFFYGVYFPAYVVLWIRNDLYPIRLQNLCHHVRIDVLEDRFVFFSDSTTAKCFGSTGSAIFN
jgi:hypothetical protein